MNADRAYPIHDRATKVARRKGRMKLNGRALKRLLNDRAAKAQATQHTPKGETKGTPSHA